MYTNICIPSVDGLILRNKSCKGDVSDVQSVEEDW